MMDTQTNLMNKIKAMDKWLDTHRSDDDRIPMTSSERSEFINRLFAVSERRKEALAILKFFQRGQVFDMPKELGEA